MSADNVRISKFLSLVLRHKPEEIGITLDEAGWVEVDTLLSACASHRFSITRQQLETVVATSDKKRFAFSEDGTRIRANQGHSVDVELGYAPAQPPEILYHGTADRFINSIRRQGLIKGKRHHVHLSLTRQTAAAVRTRHGRLVLLEVRSGDMHRAGILFYKSANDVWLTDAVPPQYLVFP
jgi:putative RNA 2'-phosphotransferase